ncbi:MAG TPA: efflux RND transporter periplasmic adaptor subunit [Candidatus Wunengus californicus]|uniref:efflux RND transporter periplasmic adaptor subunit n=1 Tax=Candidatus Wunengus californicus TaxID=3367619 RepID=UPI0040288B8B
MVNKDISKLKIDKSDAMQYRRVRRKLSLKIAAFIFAFVIGFILYRLVFNPVVEVKVSTVSQIYPSQTFTLLNASGYVVAQRKAAVASKITGRLEWLGVEEGSKVKKGQVIAKLEGEDAAAARDLAIANLDNAMFNLDMTKAEMNDATLHYNRQKELLSQGVVPQSELDIAEARYKRAKAAVAAAESAINAYKAAVHFARISLRYTFIRAPFDAVVLTKNADVGDIVAPLGAAATARAAVVTIADMDSLLVEADVSESNLQKVKIGQPCEIQLDALPENRFRGMVHMIVPTADRSKASVMVKVKFLDKDDRILPEMSAKVAFLERSVTLEEQKPKTALNSNAITMNNNTRFVFLINENRVYKTPLTTGSRIGDLIEVLDGVKSGDKVVVNPPNNLRDGMRIKVKEK